MKHIVFVLLFCILFGCTNTSNTHHASKLDSLSFLLFQDSTNITLLQDRAQIYLEKSQFELAKKDIDQAYELFKNDISLLLKRGEIYYNLNKTRVAKESWERCLKINPNQIECREKLTELLCIVGSSNCKKMIDTLALLSNDVISLSLIVALKEQKEYALTIHFLNTLLDRQPENKEALSLLSVIYSDTSRHNNYFNIELSEEYFSKILSLYPNYAQAYYNFGKHKQNLLQYRKALLLYQKNIELDPNNKYSYYNMGFCSIQLESYNQAIDYFTQAIFIDNTFLLAYHARAYLYNLIGQDDKANIDWKNCLMLNPSYIPALKALSQ